MKKLAALLCVAGLVGCTMIGWASPATGVTPTVLSRGTFDPFHLNRDPHSLVEFEARAKSPLDVVVRQHDYLPHSSTGWHSHPGPVFITVTKGTLTFYEYDDPTCSAKIVDAEHRSKPDVLADALMHHLLVHAASAGIVLLRTHG